MAAWAARMKSTQQLKIKAADEADAVATAAEVAIQQKIRSLTAELVATKSAQVKDVQPLLVALVALIGSDALLARERLQVAGTGKVVNQLSKGDVRVLEHVRQLYRGVTQYFKELVKDPTYV